MNEHIGKIILAFSIILIIIFFLGCVRQRKGPHYHTFSDSEFRNKYSALGEVLVFHLRSAPFPHPERNNGHEYNGNFYSYSAHYNDNRVLVFIPRGYVKKKNADLVVFFHGWNSDIYNAAFHHNLIEQFYRSQKNALLIIPAGPYRAPDSLGGKLDDENGFNLFIQELLGLLYGSGKVLTEDVGNIILSGFSGGYRVIAQIILKGGLYDHIQEIYLFDGYYGQEEIYQSWLLHKTRRFVNVFTEHGGTKELSIKLAQSLKEWRINHLFKEQKDLLAFDFISAQPCFIKSSYHHNSVIRKEHILQKILAGSCLEAKR